MKNKRIKITIEYIKKHVGDKYNGKCLSKKYQNGRTGKLSWKCEKGHGWSSTWNNVRNGVWCGICSGHHLDINLILEHVKKKNGKVINVKDYVNNSTKLTYECHKGHKWKASWSNIGSHKKWCPKCAKNQKLSLKFAKNVAKRRKAKLVSTKYINAAIKLDWICVAGHSFSMSLNHINSKGSWCPRCSIWTSEEICRFYLEKLFSQTFMKIKPRWLINGRGNLMELDGMSENKIGNCYLAFEHQGEQHYKKSDNIGRTNFLRDISLEQRKLDDLKKVELCKDNNVCLIIIPQLFKITKLNNLINLIKTQCVNFGIVLQDNFNKIDINIDEMYIVNKTITNKYNEIVRIIEGKKGQCLSKNYINSTIKLKIKCEFGHIFLANSHSIKAGVWCPDCRKSKKITIKEMKELAISRNGKCLSNKYVNSHFKLKWKCNIDNFVWNANASSIKHNGSWCPKCRGGVSKERFNA
jgi:hypothetical protein